MQKQKVRLTLLFSSKLVVVVRLVIILSLLILVVIQLSSSTFPKIPLFFLSIIFMVEIFMKYGLENIFPKIHLASNNGSKLDSFTKYALESILYKNKPSKFVSFIAKFPQSKFLLTKSEIGPKEIVGVGISETELIDKAFDIAKKLNGKFVTTTDLLTAYLLLTESETKILFNHELKEVDILNIAQWARVEFSEETPKIARARFVGIGFGETLMWGWTPETKKYTKDLTFSSIKKHTTIDGRESEYKTMIEKLQQTTNNNVILVGALGTGKSNLVENFIYESYEGVLGRKLNHTRLLELMIGPFIAGTVDRAELETRLQSIIEEVKHSGNVVLYIPELENLLGSGSYGVDLSGAILPYLKDGKMPIIATLTQENFKKYLETNPLREVFEPIVLEEPNSETAIKMLFQKTSEIESENKITLSYKSILAAVKFADKYELNASLPGTAVDLLTDAANSAKLAGRNIVTEEDIVSRVENKSHIPVGAPKPEEKKFLLNLEEEMHKRIVGQNEAIKSISEAVRRVRAGIAKERPISFLFLGPTGVGKTETAKALANLYFNGETHIVRLDMSEYGNLDSVNKLLMSGSGSFLDEVSSHPFCLVLLDEFEKADEKILNLFLQVLDDGRMTDNSGKTVSFNNSIIIATSNAGSEFIRESLTNNQPIDSKSLLNYLQTQAIFKPELLNRFDDIVVFKPLNQNEINQVTQIMAEEFVTNMNTHDVTVVIDPKAINKIAISGFNAEFGARPLRRYIQDDIEDAIAKKILNNEIKRGDKVYINVDNANNIAFHISS